MHRTGGASHRRQKTVARFGLLRALLVATIVGLGFVVLPIDSAVSGAATTLISDHFSHPTSTSNVNVASGGTTQTDGGPLPCLTAGPVPATPTGTIANCNLPSPDVDGSGALMLTDAGFYEESDIIYASSFPTADGLDINFDAHMYGGGGDGSIGFADGISFDLATAPPGPTTIGPPGGALGYAASGSTPGMPHGYLGVGFDEFGNYSNSVSEGSGCTDPSWEHPYAQSNQVTVRGPGNGTIGYCALSSSLEQESDPMDSIQLHGDDFSSYVHVEVVIDPTSKTYSVTLTPTTGADAGVAVPVASGPLPDSYYDAETGDLVSGHIPPQLTFAVAASSGAGNDNHEIDNFDAATKTDTPLTTLALSGTGPASAGLNGSFNMVFTPSVTSKQAEALPVTMDDTLPSNEALTAEPFGTGWDCSATDMTNNVVERVYTPTSGVTGALPAVTIPTKFTSGTIGSSVTDTATVFSSDSLAPASADVSVMLVSVFVPPPSTPNQPSQPQPPPTQPQPPPTQPTPPPTPTPPGPTPPGPTPSPVTPAPVHLFQPVTTVMPTPTPTPTPIPTPVTVPMASLTLSSPAIIPGGSTTASGTGCAPQSPVVLSILSHTVATTTANQVGDFSAPVSPPSGSGQFRVVATCGAVQLTAFLEVVASAESSNPEGGAAVFCVFVLVGVILLRGQFSTSSRQRRRRRRTAADILGTSGD